MSTHASRSGRWIWTVVVLLLVVLGILRGLANSEQSAVWLGPSFLPLTRVAFGLFTALVVAGIAFFVMTKDGGGGRSVLDRSFILLVLSWVLSSAVVLVQEGWPSETWASTARYMAYQLSVAATLNFLRLTVLASTPLVKTLILVQLTIGMALLAWRSSGSANAPWVLELWRFANLLGFSGVLIGICRVLLNRVGQPPWLSLGACLMGFGIGMNDMAVADGKSIQVTMMHNVFSAFLLMVWLMLTQRIGRFRDTRRTPREQSENSLLGGAFADSYLVGDGEEESQNRSGSPAHTKRHFAQELHDGVGSQLVNILASLDRGVPEQRDMALAVENCLLDVKILVDDIDGGEECVLDALARLRYRVQASLERLGMKLTWDIQTDPILEQLCDDRSRQILRVTQEALANVMRHSLAKHVRVSCSYQPAARALALEIADDGKGFDASGENRVAWGKGLTGMRRRADNIFSDLRIISSPGRGTMVHLMVPLGEVDAAKPSRWHRSKK